MISNETNKYFTDFAESERIRIRSTVGQRSAYMAWKNSCERLCTIVEVSCLPWDCDAHDFIECFRAAGITEFAITDNGPSLIRMLHIFCEEEGCRMAGLCQVARTECLWGEVEVNNYDGILVKIF